jgi:hypothetical protein
MGIRVVRLIAIEYPDMDSFDVDRGHWALPENGMKSYGDKIYRTSIIIAPFKDAEEHDGE